MEPASSRVRRMYRKESCQPDSFPTVNCMSGSILFRWSWKESTRSMGSAAHVSSMYCLQNVEGYERLTVPSVRCLPSPGW